MTNDRVYICIDLKSFYASVECVERGLDPMTANLVVADPERTEKTICLAVTPSLKKYGLSGRSRLFEVNQKLREIKRNTGKEIEYITAVPRMALYIEYSARIYGIYLKYVSHEDMHVYSIDEIFMDVTNYLSMYHMSAHEFAKRIIQDVRETTGITATAGIAPNLYLCKVAMDIGSKRVPEDKDGVRIAELDEMSYRKKLWEHQPLTDFWRIGPGIAARLEKNGIHTMGDIARISLYHENWLYKLFGIDAELLIDHAWGYEPCSISDIKGYKPKKNSICAGQVLQCPYGYDKAKTVIREMSEWIALALVEKGLATDSLTLRISYDRQSMDDGTYKGAVHIDQYGRTLPKSAHGTANLGTMSSSSQKITEAVLHLYDQIIDRKLLVHKISLTANNVADETFRQYDLFTDPVQVERERKMQQMMLDIQKRFGKNAILKGTSLEAGATTRDRNRQIGGHRA